MQHFFNKRNFDEEIGIYHTVIKGTLQAKTAQCVTAIAGPDRALHDTGSQKIPKKGPLYHSGLSVLCQ